MVRQTFEGSWEELVQHAAELRGHRVRLTILDEKPAAPQSLDKLMTGYVGSVTSPHPDNLSERVEEEFGKMLSEKHAKESRQ